MQVFYKKGFTLIELMLVVVLIGVLFTIAVTTYSVFHKRARMTEAKANLGEIRTHEESYYLENLRYLSCPAHPATPPAATTTTWTATAVPAEWNELGFAIEGQICYSYAVQNSDGGQNFTATAQGDLDGDSTYSTFSLTKDSSTIQETLPLE